LQREHKAEVEAERRFKCRTAAVGVPGRNHRHARATGQVGVHAAAACRARPGASPPATAAEPMLNRILAKAMQLHASDVHIHTGVQISDEDRWATAQGQLAATRSGAIRVHDPANSDSKRTAPSLLPTTILISPTPSGRRPLSRQRLTASDGESMRSFARYRLKPPTLDQLGLPSSLARLTTYHQGLVLVTGPAGCGKSSTLAALINLINEDRPDHIICVEDPIAFVHRSKTCVVNQRQVHNTPDLSPPRCGRHCARIPTSSPSANCATLRPSRWPITAAETGHLVLGTLHQTDAARTITVFSTPTRRTSNRRSVP